jgi:tripeptidyl-peptidase-1
MYAHATQPHLHIARCEGYSLPAELAAHVALVGPATRFPALRAPMTAQHPLPAEGEDEAAEAAKAATVAATYSNNPANLRLLYGVGGAVGGLAKQAVTAFLGQYLRTADLQNFFATYLPIAADTPIALVGDATEGLPAGVEAMLDVEYMPSLGALNPTGFWGFSGASPQDAADEPFLTWLVTVANTSDAAVPLLFSTSYGEDEAQEVPSAYADRINVEFVKCGLRGISLLLASGDSGAASDSGTCPNGVFLPKWPAASPYVTAVGGATNGALPESAWSGSSGGFSDEFAQPPWQASAVATFLATAGAAGTLPNAAYFNASGRGFPDIAAQSVNFPVVANGVTLAAVGGTSCAAPTAGGIFGLLNHARRAAQKTSLGFLNPLLYAYPQALNDVAQGVQGGCSIGGASVEGFPAVKGWDAVTGLGSPNYPALLEVVLALN